MGHFSQAIKKMVGLRSGRLAKSWQHDVHAGLLVPPAVADIDGDGESEIIIGTTNGELIVLDTAAKERWRYSIHEEIGNVEAMFLDQDVMQSINAPPAVADVTGDGKHNIVFGSEMGVLYCLDELGKLVWKFKTEGGIRGSPLIADINNDGKPEIVFGCTDQFLYLLNNQGKLIEKFGQDAPIESTPGFSGGKIIFGTNDGTILAVDAAGELIWQHKTGGKITAAPAFADLQNDGVDEVIIGSTDNSLYCLDIDGELVWSYETGGAIYSKATIADLNGDGKPEILIGSCDNNIHAVTPEGERYWTYETDFWVVGTPLVADVDGDGKLEVIAGSYDHNVYILDSEGSYLLDYMPGLSGVVQQTGHYAEVMTSEPGQHVGKKLWQFKTDGVVMGCTALGHGLVVTTKKGIIDTISHQAN